LTPEITNEKQNALEELFWMIEEYKVSVFAQELKTSSPVSEKRILSKFAEISVMV
jgi:ATP-dependent helicase HrpA